jgi:hypothetical protein
MSAWVAPSIAAEIWGISVDQVLAGIADGSVQSYVDGQFLFVDLGRQGLPMTTPRERKLEAVVTEEEIAALTFQPIDSASEPLLSEMTMSEPSVANEQILQVTDEDFGNNSDWRLSREQTSRLRKPPSAQAA